MSVSAVSSGSTSVASHTAGGLATAGVLGIVGVAAAAFAPADARIQHPPAIQQAMREEQSQAEKAARKKLDEIEDKIKRLNGDKKPRDKKIERVQLCVEHADLIQNVSSSTALERTSSQNRAYEAALSGASLVVEGREMPTTPDPSALESWIECLRFFDTAARFAPNHRQALGYLQRAIQLAKALRAIYPDSSFSDEDQRLIMSLNEKARNLQPSAATTLLLMVAALTTVLGAVGVLRTSV